MPDLPDLIHLLPKILIASLLGYLIGSIPFGLILTKIAGLGDVRKIGSGNIGATNVLRTGNKALAAATLAGDLLKGTVAVLIGAYLGTSSSLLAGLSAFLGHLFPIWLKFKGGKGVATYIGVLLGVHWPTAFFFCGVWLIVAVISRYSSLSALIASLLSPVIPIFYDRFDASFLFAVMSILVFIRHQANIKRLLTGEETKISGKQ